MMLKAKSKTIMKVPKSLLESEVFFKSLEDNMNKLKKEEARYINQKLNNYFQNELLLGLIGNKITDKLSKQFNSHIAKLDYTKYTNVTPLQAVNELLTYIENSDSSLKQDISKIKESFSSVASSVSSSSSSSSISAPISIIADQKIGALLDLKIPLKDNRIFREELNREKTRHYISLAGLNPSLRDKLLEVKLDLYQFPHDIIFDLVKSKIISEKQAHSLKNIASLTRITGDNPKFVKLLAGKNIKSVVDLISWEISNWENFIVKQEIPLPTNVTSTKRYAENIKFNIERSYLTQILLTRAGDSSTVSSADSRLIDSVNKLLKTNNKLIESGDIAIVNWRQINKTQKSKMKKTLNQLAAFSNFYKHIGIQDFINNKKMSIAKKKAAIKTTINHIRTFNINNPELDLRLLNFFDNDEMQKLDWRGIPSTDKPRTRKQMMAYQRVLTLSDQPLEHMLLMAKGFDSAISIGRMTQQEFETTCGLKPDRARMVYYKAQQQLIRTAHNFEAIRDVSRGEFQRIRTSNLNPSLVNDLQEIDGFEELFGSQNYCACQECMSILSPAAYFVDLMRFIHENISKKTFLDPSPPLIDHPLYLKNRRSDFWQMQISCENTHTLIPYLNIVNDVLQAYLGKVVPGLGGATGKDIFEILYQDSQDTKISFSLPFNLPLEEIQTYLGHFGISIFDIYKILKRSEQKIWRSRLGLSKEQFKVIVEPDLTHVKFRFGDPSSFSDFLVQDFLNATGLNRGQLDELLQIGFNSDLANIVIDKKPDADELQNFEEVLNNLNNSRLDFIHRFIQLLRRVKWSIPELDMVLNASKDSTPENSILDSNAVIKVAKLADINETLKLSIEELCCMTDSLPVSASYPNPPPKENDKKLFERIFDIKGLFEDPDTLIIKSTTEFHHFSFNTNDTADTHVDPKMSLLLSGLGITEAELVLLFRVIKQEIEFNDDGNCILDLDKISKLYRHVRIAKALKFRSIDDFVNALSICFKVPPEPAFVIDSIDHISQIIEFRNWLKASPFNVNEISLILFGQENSSIQFSTTLETVIAMVKEVQQEIQNSKETDKIKLLKAAISTLVNVSSDHLKQRIFPWVKTDPESDEIKSSLNTKFDDDGNPIPQDSLNPLIDMIHEIERVMLIFSNLKFTEKTVDKIAKQKEHLGIEDLKNLTLENLQSLTTYHRILDSMIEDKEKRDSDKSIGKLLDDYLAPSPSPRQFSKESISILATLWNKNKDVLESISRLNVLQDIPISIDAIYLLWKLSNICQTLGINGYLLNKIAQDEDFEKLSIARNTVLGSLSSKYDNQKIRQEKLEIYQDIINKRKSDIFCDYILSLKKNLKFKNRNAIYSFFLLDPEMGGCARISRIVSAISSLQLYVHRCMVNLEQSDKKLNPEIPDIRVDPAFIPRDEWEWRKNYRVWEANRKVFLYPENYLEPDLRDNKTPQFKELEDELLQQKITKDSAEVAYRKYVSQYAELARLEISGAYAGINNGINSYFFFGRTQQEPHQYYYRKLIEDKDGASFFTPYEKIDVTINSDRVSALVHLGKLYIFWVEKIKKPKPTVDSGNMKENWRHERYLAFSSLNEFGKWIPPQKLSQKLFLFGYDDEKEEEEEQDFFVYPVVKEEEESKNKIYISFYHRPKLQPAVLSTFELNLFRNKLMKVTNDGTVPIEIKWLTIIRTPPINHHLVRMESPEELIHEVVIEWELQQRKLKPSLPNEGVFSTELKTFPDLPELHLIGNKYGDLILNLGNQQYHIRYEKDNEFEPPIITRSMKRLSTSVHDRFGEILFTEGIEKFLSLETQREKEIPVGVTFIGPPELSGPEENSANLDFLGAYGEYYEELFFHIPFLIAHSLNANQRFMDAKWWYERIFDPTSSESTAGLNPQTDRNWRYIKFRGNAIEKMRTILTNEKAIKKYKDDPFNPHAIAHLRLSAYPKTIVMKYIDNLLDWGDHLFSQDTVESINEASMLYVLSLDILGERPVKLGNCDSTMEETQNLTYQIIEEKGKFESDFLITLENWDHVNNIRAGVSTKSDGDGGLPNNTGREIFRFNPEVGYYDTIVNKRKSLKLSTDKLANLSLDNQNLSHLSGIITNVVENKLLFCIPENKDLLNYWDRVEDRLFKIRNCMNISGVRRSLALFQPPISPMLLVKAKAAGLALEDILKPDINLLYRFTYLIEKAKQFAQTVQSFGSTLLVALEKKNTEELLLLRSVHERNILNLTKEIKKKQLEDATAQHQAMIESRTNVQNRKDHYTNLIEKGLSSSENSQEGNKIESTRALESSTLYSFLASLAFLVPQFGSPVAMTYGGREIGASLSAAVSLFMNSSQKADSRSASNNIRANFDRREEEWKHQLDLAEQELKSMDKQVTAYDIRRMIAEKEIEIHDKNVEQTNELDDFYRNKFTNLGLYNYLSTSMYRLHREAYNLAYDMAKKAEQAYKFEQGDNDIPFISDVNWQFDRAGLLAGERLTLQLERMEKTYLDNNKRENEITQSFSLAILNPQALTDLKEKGECGFIIPEIMFNLFYPGQYKRIIKSVRITIPCVTGPYTNISAKLSLEGSKVRNDPDIQIEPTLIPNINISATSISTSSAQNDSGTFEFSFRDERYLPFEGAGAIDSNWKLRLPSVFRSFDYDTISDVIIHISYTAKEGNDEFRSSVEEKIQEDLNKLALNEGLSRLISLKHDFPSAFYKLLNPREGENQVTEFVIGKNYFPYFLSDKDLDLSSPTTIYLKPKGDNPIDTSSLTLVVNDGDATVNSADWKIPEKTKLQEASLVVSGKPDRKWTIVAGIDGFDKEKLDDIMILMKYKIQ